MTYQRGVCNFRNPILGLRYGPSTTPIGALPLSSVTALHLCRILAHPPDNVLFPFLHGLDGDKEATHLASTALLKPKPKLAHSSCPQVRFLAAPRYHGLHWVVCQDSLPNSAAVLLTRLDHGMDRAMSVQCMANNQT